MTTIATVVQTIVTAVAAVTNITRAHTYPPDSVNQNLQAVIYPSNIQWQWGPMFQYKVVTFDVNIDLVCTVPDAARQVAALVPFCDSIPAALFDDEFLNSGVQQWDGIAGGLLQREDNGQMMLRLTVQTCTIEATL